MTASEFEEWQAFNRIEPFGGDVNEVRFGIAASMFGNYARDPKRSEAFSPTDFFVSEHMRKKLDKPQTAEDQISIIRELQEAFRTKQ